MAETLTNAGLGVAGSAFLNCSLTHFLLRLAASATHLDSTVALLAAGRPATPTGPAFCKETTAKKV